MSRERGFSLIEILAGLLILAFVLTTSLAVFVERQRRLRHADELIAIYQALANEAEIARIVPFSSLTPGEGTFRSDTSILDGLEGVRTTVTVSNWKSGARLVEMKVEWRDGARSEVLTVVRADTGPGGAFW